ncbi:hypothetical protein FB451DRAFT_1562454 [Mycena latifolia]|nr:hypothetical protein FB451DRAFT_1562454 [Mycena latifolia]
MAAARVIYLKSAFGGVTALAIVIFAGFSIYWGAVWKAPEHTLPGWIVAKRSLPRLGGINPGKSGVAWQIISASQFPDGIPQLENAIVQEQTWYVLAIERGTSTNLTSAVSVADSSYNPSLAITLMGSEARNEDIYRVHSRIVSIQLDAVTHQFALQFTKTSLLHPTLQAELSDMQQELIVARDDAKTEPSTEATACVRELENTLTDLEGKLKLAKAEAKSNSSGRVRARAPKASAAPNAPAQPAADPTPTLDALPAPAPTASIVSAADGTVDLVRRVSARKRVQTESSATASAPSGKRRKKLEDPLAGWVMQDPDTGEKLTGHEWVERYPEEFEERYKKDHQRYLEYLAQ